MTARNEDFLFAQEAQNLGFVTEEQVEEGFLLQRRMTEDLKMDERLAVILVKRGWMAEEQAKRVYSIIEPEGAKSEIEGYRLVEKIGRGAMGTVYRAVHKGLRRIVAIKILRRDLLADRTQIERLKAEAQMLADLDHPNVVRALDAGESNGFPYLVMEYVEGENLRDKIARVGPLEEEEALRITRGLADALERARRMGVVHRDVKPGNVLIAKNGEPKLMDLGLAKGPIDMELTQHGATVGTPQFISPEQAQDARKADTRSDIYSLGGSLYAMLTRRPPFEGSTMGEILTKVLTQQPTPVRGRNKNVSTEVSYLVERMMLKDPTLRYQTPAEVVADIDMIRGGQSIIPQGFTGNWEAFLLRKRQKKLLKVISVGAVVLLVLVGGLFLYLRGKQRATARLRADEVAQDILDETRVSVEMDLDRVNALLAKFDHLEDDLQAWEAQGGMASEMRPQVDARGQLLHRLKEALGAYAALDERVGKELLDLGSYGKAVMAIHEFQRSHPGLPQIQNRTAKLERDVIDASMRAWNAKRDGILARTSANLDEFVRIWMDLAQESQRDYVLPNQGMPAQRRWATQLNETAHAIRKIVHDADAEYGEDVVRKRVEALQFYRLNQAFARRKEQVLSDANNRADVFRRVQVDLGRLFGPYGHVTAALADIRTRIDGQVQDLWKRIEKDTRALEGIEPIPDAVKNIQAFQSEAERGSAYGDLAKTAEALVSETKARYQTLLTARDAWFEGTREKALTALRRGDPAGIEQAVDVGKQGWKPEWGEASQRLESLRGAAAILRGLQDEALTYLAGLPDGARLTDVALRANGAGPVVEKRWDVQRVDTNQRKIVVTTRRTRPEVREVPIQEVHLDQVRRWVLVNRRKSTLRPREQAILELAMLPLTDPEPGVDLRPGIAACKRAAQAFRKAQDKSHWGDYVTGQVQALELEQDQREEQFSESFALAENFFFRGNALLALRRLEVLMDPTGSLRYTDQYDKRRERLDDLKRKAQRLKEQDDFQEIVPGAKVELLADKRYRFTLDFDTKDQLWIPTHGFGMLVPQAQAVVTPQGSSQKQRLHLLKGVEGLLRDRPLAFHTMFDPADEIVVELTIDTLAGSFLLAFDIDGLQVAICSANPRSQRWRFGPDVPLLEDEDKPPLFNFYGRGCGVAFDWGPHFGESFPVGKRWAWPDKGAGRNHERWSDPKFMRRAKRVFHFEPGTTYRVKIVRKRGRLELWVGGKLVTAEERPGWEEVGKRSREGRIRGGSGKIQILTWTPLAIDDLILEGTLIGEDWKRRQRKRIKALMDGK